MHVKEGITDQTWCIVVAEETFQLTIKLPDGQGEGVKIIVCI